MGKQALGVFAEDLVRIELAPGDEDAPAAASAWVVERVTGAGTLTRWGLLGIAAGVDLAMLALHRRPYARLEPPQRLAVARRLANTRAPLAAEWVRAVRSLAVTEVFERRYAVNETPQGKFIQ